MAPMALIIAATNMAMVKVRTKQARANRVNFSSNSDSCKGRTLPSSSLPPSSYHVLNQLAAVILYFEAGFVNGLH
jgi:hypothetical protein